MTPFSFDYIVPGDVFSDETVLCQKCGKQISGLSYKEMPSVKNPKDHVNVAYKMPYSNYRNLAVILYRRGKCSIVNLNVCQECIHLDPVEFSDAIIKQIVRAFQIQARWANQTQAAVNAVERQFSDAKILRCARMSEIENQKIEEN